MQINYLLAFILIQLSGIVDAFNYPFSYKFSNRIKSHCLFHSQTGDESNIETEGIRLNKVFKATHSRREADALIENGRVSVNGELVTNKGGFKVFPFKDVIRLDGKIVTGWEKMNAIAEKKSQVNKIRNISRDGNSKSKDSSKDGKMNDNDLLHTSNFEYVKYFKPIKVTCTTDKRVKDNIIDAIMEDGYMPRHRVYPIGRLDKETSGLIILTSDGRVVNNVLRGEKKQPKKYKVMVNGRLEESDLQRLRDGITIRTVAQRKGRSIEENTLIAKTKPAIVERIGPCSCQMTIVEGRNRQIRKMMQALGFTVTRLHRIEFMGIKLQSSGQSLNRPGDWAHLTDDEMALVEAALKSVQ